MVDLRTSTDTPSINGSDHFGAATSLRQPAEGLGPRAQRTVTRILDATREVFLSRGYSGTTVDEIARIADVSRASFYTYFPSKREVLVALGEQSARDSLALIDGLAEIGPGKAGMTAWVTSYFDYLDVYGSFAFAWTQASQEDEELRIAGMRGHLRICRRLGRLLAETAGKTVEQPAILGIVAASTLERTWNYGQLYRDAIDRFALINEASITLWSLARQAGPKAS